MLSRSPSDTSQRPFDLFSLQQQEQHDHRRFRLDTVPQADRHVDPGAGLGIESIVSQRDPRLALEEVQDGRHRGGVFGKLLALGKAEGDPLEPGPSLPVFKTANGLYCLGRQGIVCDGVGREAVGDEGVEQKPHDHN